MLHMYCYSPLQPATARYTSATARYSPLRLGQIVLEHRADNATREPVLKKGSRVRHVTHGPGVVLKAKPAAARAALAVMHASSERSALSVTIRERNERNQAAGKGVGGPGVSEPGVSGPGVSCDPSSPQRTCSPAGQRGRSDSEEEAEDEAPTVEELRVHIIHLGDVTKQGGLPRLESTKLTKLTNGGVMRGSDSASSAAAGPI